MDDIEVTTDLRDEEGRGVETVLRQFATQERQQGVSIGRDTHPREP